MVNFKPGDMFKFDFQYKVGVSLFIIKNEGVYIGLITGDEYLLTDNIRFVVVTSIFRDAFV